LGRVAAGPAQGVGRVAAAEREPVVVLALLLVLAPELGRRAALCRELALELSLVPELGLGPLLELELAGRVAMG
jgi:hypothetical protein